MDHLQDCKLVPKLYLCRFSTIVVYPISASSILTVLRSDYPDKKLIDSLAVDEEHLDMIKAFTPWLDIRQRADRPEPRPVRIDPINGKGEGQIMLFHGPPGTGKTFTVECIAEYSSIVLLHRSWNHTDKANNLRSTTSSNISW